jgi:hypothetical protein
MKIRRRSKKLAAGTGVVLATASLSACNGNGDDILHGDPVPPPLQCNTVDEGETLTATATVAGTELRVSIRSSALANWATVEVVSVTGGSARPVAPAEPLVVVIDLADATVTSGAFTLNGTMRGFRGEQCAVSRRFTFTIASNGVTVAQAGELPLPARQQARIELLSRDGHDVELLASTAYRGDQTVTWTVSGGEVLARDGARLRWRLPGEPGLYQAELVIDYGTRGLSFDTLVLEVV